MAQLTWDTVGNRFYESGVDRGVLYVDDAGVPWNGLTAIDESPSGGEARPFYIDGVKYLNLAAQEEFEATVTAYYSPEEFDQCDGIGMLVEGLTAGQQRRKSFGLSYRTKIGNDTVGADFGYKIHIIYNALVAPTAHNYATVSDSVDIPLLSWPISTKPVPVPGMMRSAHLVVDSTKVSRASLEEIEKVLYGTELTPASLPTPAELVDIIATADLFSVVDLGGGKFRISGRNENIFLASPGLYEITHPTAVVLVTDGAHITSV